MHACSSSSKHSATLPSVCTGPLRPRSDLAVNATCSRLVDLGCERRQPIVGRSCRSSTAVVIASAVEHTMRTGPDLILVLATTGG